MKTVLRRIGNSLGVIIPKAILASWNVGEGDALHISGEGIFPRKPPTGPQALDERNRRIAAAVVAALRRAPPR
ncbi:MAG: AbrB/MazE/SpoVT family DNA-binding domain-containing protein [Bacillota bacterium]